MQAGYRSAAIAAAALLGSCTTPDGPALAEFEGVLAAQDSATAALSQWCGRRKIAAVPQIRAHRLKDRTPALPADLYRLLDLPTGMKPAYRHVRLSCGDAVLSDSHNWYVPARLTADMNRMLDSTDTPFGKIAAPLAFRRERLSSKRGRDSACPRDTVLSHRALLRLPDGAPLALVLECYTRANLRAEEPGSRQ